MSTCNKKYGVYFGEKKGICNAVQRVCGADRSEVKRIDEDGNVAINGGPGSGKTTCCVIPTLSRWKDGTFAAIDIKGDLKRIYDKRHPGSKSKVFSLRGDSGCTYDPFTFIRQDGEDNRVANVRELVNALLPLPVDIKDPVWIQSAREILTAAFLYYEEIGVIFTDAVLSTMSTPLDKLIDNICEYGSDTSRIFINNFIGDTTLSDSKFLVGIMQEITNRLSIFATDLRVINALTPSENQLRWTDLESHSIFLSVPEDRLEQYGPVLTMMMTQLIRTLERRPEKYSPEGANKRPILLMLDEFPRLGKIEVISSAVSTLQSKNVTICLVFQSLAQLDAIYGRETRRILLDNCTYKAILGAGDAETQKYLSDLCGTTPVIHRNRSTSYDSNKQVMGYSEQISVNHEPAIRPHEFAMLKDIVLLTPKGAERVKKVPYYETGFISKVRSFVSRVIGKIKDFFNWRRSVCHG